MSFWINKSFNICSGFKDASFMESCAQNTFGKLNNFKDLQETLWFLKSDWLFTLLISQTLMGGKFCTFLWNHVFFGQSLKRKF